MVRKWAPESARTWRAVELARPYFYAILVSTTRVPKVASLSFLTVQHHN